MSHEIEKNEDYVYATTDGLPWHGLGVQRGRRMTLDEVTEALPRLAEEPILCRVYYRDPSNTQERVAKECDSKRAIVFPSDGQYVGMATDVYKPKAYAEAFRKVFGWVDALGAWVSGAALLRGGSRAFITARVPSLDFTVENDRHTLWLTLFAGSDGQTGIYPYATFVRPVCANTVAMGISESKRDGRFWNIKHAGNVDAKLEEASIGLSEIASVRDAYGKACEVMLNKAISKADEQALVETLIKGESTRAQNARDKIIELAHFGRGNKAYEGTAYALWQGVTDYVDHAAVQSSKGDVNERRFLYAVEGAGADLKARALALFVPDRIAA